MSILNIILLISFYISCTVTLCISKHQKAVSSKIKSLSSVHVIKKRKVPLKDELEFYKEVNEIKPEMLEILMANFTGEPYAPSPPSNNCCLNGGTCFVPTNDRADRFCRCPPNFKGRYCAEDVDECKSPGACGEHEVICRNTYGGYECNCEEGYIRENLQCIKRISCYEDPCRNFSECVDVGEGSILCICRPGFKGTWCEIRIPECEDSSCNENETCVATSDGFICQAA